MVTMVWVVGRNWFKAPSGTSEVGYTSATAGGGTTKSERTCGGIGKKNISGSRLEF